MVHKNEPLTTFLVDKLKVALYPSRQELGEAAARLVAEEMRRRLAEKERIAMIFAAAPSQEEFLAALSAQANVDWQRVMAFQMDEYVGLSSTAPQSFGRFLKDRLFRQVQPGQVHYLNPGENASEEVRRYGQLLRESPPDITCAGVGENGHLAFNDPPIADFQDPLAIRQVELAERSRVQQVSDHCFANIHQVPTTALTLTIPTLLSAGYVSCVVPGATKADAIKQMLLGPITTDCPASILRSHSNAILHLDQESAAGISDLIPRREFA